MGKRANGEGSIYQQKNGLWVACVTVEGRKRKYVYGKTQKEVTQAKQKLLQDLSRGVVQFTCEQTVEIFLRSWLEDTVKPNLRYKTYEHYRWCVKHVVAEIGSIQLWKLTPQHIQRLLARKRAEGCAPQSVKHFHRMLGKALNDAVKWGLVERNVVSLVTPPRVPRSEMRVLTAEQAQRFLTAASGNFLEALFVLAITTGAREGELLGLSWDDVNLQTGKMHIRRALGRQAKKGLVLVEPKTERSRRTIYLAPLAIDALKEHQLRQQHLKGFGEPGWNEYNLVFCNHFGKPFDPSSMVNDYFRPLLVKAGLPLIRFHDLRHTAATLMLQLEVHPKVVQEMLGHSSIGITLDTYSHAIPTMQIGAAGRLSDLLTRS
ncbi:MAG TPA: site-specific integrase [Ktedonobacteraceae bacterium]|nr:site-specific integrase [Ktedonobacteraceae bacterium]